MTETKAVKLDKGQAISHTRKSNKSETGKDAAPTSSSSSKLGKKRKAKSDNVAVQSGDSQAIDGSDDEDDESDVVG